MPWINIQKSNIYANTVGNVFQRWPGQDNLTPEIAKGERTPLMEKAGPINGWSIGLLKNNGG